MNAINNIKTYSDRMTKSLIDKMFFMDKIDVDLIVDFGCADAALLKFIHHNFENYDYVGYDISQEMIEAAQENVKETNIQLHSNFDDVRRIIRNKQDDGGKVAIVLSSVIHEIYSYDEEKIKEFWSMLFGLNVEYIVIRDMCVSQTTSRPSDPISVARVRQIFDPHLINEWEATWGNLAENWSLVHFLLTYHYVDNWDRELKENYLPINYEKLISLIPKEYFPDFISHYTLPYIRNKVYNDFGIQLQDRTHLKLILRKHE